MDDFIAGRTERTSRRGGGEPETVCRLSVLSLRRRVGVARRRNQLINNFTRVVGGGRLLCVGLCELQWATIRPPLALAHPVVSYSSETVLISASAIEDRRLTKDIPLMVANEITNSSLPEMFGKNDV